METIASAGWGRWFLFLLIAGNGVAFIVGALLWMRPQRYLHWLEPDRGSPRSLRQLLKPLDIMRNADNLLMGYPKLIGAIIVVSALYILLKGGAFVASIGTNEGGRMLERLFSTGQIWHPYLWQVLWQSLVLMLGFGVVLALAVGLLALNRFELLMRWSEIANRWVSSRRATRPFAHPFYGPDGQVRARPRLWGVVISAAALYSAAVLFWLVAR